MFFLIRIFLALAGALFRLASKNANRGKPEVIDGKTYLYTESRNKHGTITKTEYALQLPSKVAFSLACETGTDTFFKACRTTVEFQTGDEYFDNEVYICSDHPAFCRILKEDSEIRKMILSLLEGRDLLKGLRLTSDGEFFVLHKKLGEATVGELRIFDAICEKLNTALAYLPSRFADPFVWRALIVECVIWSIAGYAAGAYIDLIFRRQDFHVNQSEIIVYGILLAAIVFVFLMCFAVVFLQRSSRSHRVITESALVLLVSLPVWGAQAISDINRTHDNKMIMSGTAEVFNKREIRHKRRRGGVYYTYHIYTGDFVRNDESQKTIKLPKDIQIPQELYERIDIGEKIPMELGQGTLGIPWYQSIDGYTYEK